MMTGRELWRTRIDDHPAARVTGSPALVGATLFVPVSSIEEATGFSPLNPTIALLLDNKVGGGRLYAALGYRVEREEELNGAGPRQTVGLRATKPRLCHRL